MKTTNEFMKNVIHLPDNVTLSFLKSLYTYHCKWTLLYKVVKEDSAFKNVYVNHILYTNKEEALENIMEQMMNTDQICDDENRTIQRIIK